MQRESNYLILNFFTMGNYAGFQSVKLTKPQRSSFDLTHDKRLTTRMGRLTPVTILECVPSDSFSGSSEMLLRLAPLLAPIYDQIELYVHFFFVPNRLLWEDWEEFITGGRLGVGVDPVTAPVPPFIDLGEALTSDPSLLANGSLADYLGVPDVLDIDPVVANWADKMIDAMPFLAYQSVFREYYFDRNFTADSSYEFPVPSGQIPNANATVSVLPIRTRAYLHDYFTSALPFTQRGEEVLIPIDVALTYRDEAIFYDTSVPSVAPAGAFSAFGSSLVGPNGETASGINTPGKNGLGIDNIESLSNGTSTINDFRAAYALQVWLERNAVGGSRYTESTQAHFGVKPQDSRLQRPEYIGGGRIPVRISEVLATSWSNDGTADVPQANMAGHGVTYGNTNRFNYFCTEHGFIIGIASIMNPPSYQQGLPRMFRRRSFLDYPWPTFAKLGEQEVHNYEIYMTPASVTEDVDGNVPLFGYQSRYADWKYMCTTNHGEFRDSLLFWTLTRVFSSTPVLGASFILFDEGTQNRIFAVGETTSQNFWLYIHNKIHVKRPLPYFGTPNTLGFS